MNRLLACTALTLSLLGNAAAQDRTIQHTRYYTVKRDRIADWESAIKDLNALYKKANVEAPTLVLQSLTGPEHFLILRNYEKVSEAVANRGDAFKNNFEAEYRALNIRLMATVDDRRTRVAERDVELSLPRAQSIPPYIRTIRTEVKPGKVDEFRALIREWVKDGLKPSGVKLYSVTRTRLGGPGTEFISGTGVNTLQELDENAARKAMGEAKYNAWSARRDTVIYSSEINLYRYRPELSTWTAPR